MGYYSPGLSHTDLVTNYSFGPWCSISLVGVSLCVYQDLTAYRLLCVSWCYWSTVDRKCDVLGVAIPGEDSHVLLPSNLCDHWHTLARKEVHYSCFPLNWSLRDKLGPWSDRLVTLICPSSFRMFSLIRFLFFLLFLLLLAKLLWGNFLGGLWSCWLLPLFLWFQSWPSSGWI